MRKKQLQIFKIRDLRKKTQFKMDDEYLNGWARYCGINATLVYLSLCRHAEFHTQKAFPSQKKIAWEHGISERTVTRGIKKLISFKILLIEKERIGGKFENNIYVLLDKSVWKKPNHVTHSHLVPPCDSHHVTHSHLEGLQREKDTKKREESSFSKKKLKPYFEKLEMRKARGKWWVLPADGSQWLEFAGKEKDITWK